MIKTDVKLRTLLYIAGGLVLLFGVGILDYVTGYELSFSSFYIIPIVLIVWVTNGRTGVVISFISAGIWLMADIFSGSNYSHPLIPVWNSIVRLSFFLLVVLLVKLGRDLEHERAFSRFDFLTGAANRRFFHEIAQREIDRSIRYRLPLTIAYIDIDDFKAINDRLGHWTGDKVLRTIANCMLGQLRRTDFVARLGGDEFAILLPEANSANARTILFKIQRSFADKMQQKHWAVTFSIGVMTFNLLPASVDELLKMADQAMYQVKKKGKNNISFFTHPPEEH